MDGRFQSCHCKPCRRHRQPGQTNNFITVEQMTNQFLNIAVSNAAANSNIQVAPTVVGITQKQ
jgi:hypothetical protein